jgi:hypothetical protein
MAELDGLVDVLAEAVADRVVRKLMAGQSDHVNQAASPLGPRKHCAAVRRRLEAGEDGAAVVGRLHLLSRAALADELARAAPKRTPTREPRPDLLTEYRRKSA